VTESKLPRSIADVVKTLIFGSGAGLGAMVAYIVWDAVHAKPDLAIQLIGQLMNGQSALTIVLLVVVYFGDKRVGEGIQVMRENTSAQRDLADAVKTMASKDDREAEEQRLLMSYIATQQEKILKKLDEPMARGASAHD
jgi:biopolymer transport protein ExbB/TolQ